MNKDIIFNAVKVLEKGKIIVYPTDTIYALGADIYNLNAVKKVFNIKKRADRYPFSVAVSDLNEMKKICFTNDIVEVIVEKILPGPLTLILNKKESVPDIVTGGSNKIAIRIPKNKIALDILSKFGPLTATSANIHGKEPSHVINEISMQFGKGISLYIDDGKLNRPASTIVDLTGEKPIIVRQGLINIKEILKVIKNG